MLLVEKPLPFHEYQLLFTSNRNAIQSSVAEIVKVV